MLALRALAGWFTATLRMLAATLRMFLGFRNETDWIAGLDAIKQCADDAAEMSRGRAPCFSTSQRLVSVCCELTIVYFPW